MHVYVVRKPGLAWSDVVAESPNDAAERYMIQRPELFDDEGEVIELELRIHHHSKVFHATVCCDVLEISCEATVLDTPTAEDGQLLADYIRDVPPAKT